VLPAANTDYQVFLELLDRIQSQNTVSHLFVRYTGELIPSRVGMPISSTVRVVNFNNVILQ